jgi:hypothetical protein
VRPVKTLIVPFGILLIAFASNFPELCYSQCTSLKSVSYDSIVAGSGLESHVIDLPQFDPSKGTLVAVKITSVISLEYAFQLENNAHSAANFTLGIGRNDYISTSALSSPVSNTNNIMKYYGPYSLAASDGVVGSGPDYISVPFFPVLSNYLDINDSITDGIAGFLGTGNVEFDYTTNTYHSLSGNYTYNFTASDTLDFTVTYYYCDKAVAAPSVTSFAANIRGTNTVNLVWQTANEQADRNYTLQKSSDDTTFDDLVSIKSTGDSTLASYLYNYAITSKDKSEIYFRLKITDTTPIVQYSAVRSVKLQETSNTPIVPSVLTLYPNPSNTFINIVFNQPADNWQIDIISSDGVILQRSRFANASMAQIGFIKKLPPAAYFIHAFDLSLQKSYVLTFLVQ